MPPANESGAFVLTVDVEPDGREMGPGGVAAWEGFVICAQLLRALRPRLRERLGRPVAFNWFLRMDTQVEHRGGRAESVAERYPELLCELEREGDGVGLHVHACRPESGGGWCTDTADTAWVLDSCRSAARAFSRAMGRPARVFRFGDRFLSEALIAELPRLGIRYDLTLEPGQKPARQMVAEERATGSLPDFRGAPRHPYRPSRSSYLQPASRWWQARRLWMVPIATACVNGVPLPERIGDEHDMVHLNLSLRPEWIALILAAVSAAEHPVIASVARTGDLVSREALANFSANLERLTDPALAGRAFTTAPAAVAQYRRMQRIASRPPAS